MGTEFGVWITQLACIGGVWSHDNMAWDAIHDVINGLIFTFACRYTVKYSQLLSDNEFSIFNITTYHISDVTAHLPF